MGPLAPRFGSQKSTPAMPPLRNRIRGKKLLNDEWKVSAPARVCTEVTPTGGMPEFGRVAARKDIERIDRLERQDQPRLAADRIGFVEAVHEQRTLQRPRTGHTDEAIGPPHDVREQRQHVVVLAVGQHPGVDDLAGDGDRRIGMDFADDRLRLVASNGDLFLMRRQAQGQVQGDIAPGEVHGPLNRLEPGQFSLQPVLAARCIQRVRTG